MLALASDVLVNDLRVSEFTLNRGPEAVTISTANAKATVVVFVSAVCPVSERYIERLNDLHARFRDTNVQFVTANPNANESWPDIIKHATTNGVAYPVYRDDENRLADRLGARSTPEAFVFDKTGQLRYRGQIDEAVNEVRVRIRSLRDAVDAVLAGRKVINPETRAVGCAIHRVKK
jgi:alkyl hydroperoxide reductase subunit AhpC